MEVKLTIHRIGDSEREVVLSKFPAVIGRSDTADVHLDDHYVSRRHCEICLLTWRQRLTVSGQKETKNDST